MAEEVNSRLITADIVASKQWNDVSVTVITASMLSEKEEDGVTYKYEGIDESAFSGCSNIKSVKIPANIRTIGVGAFAGCENLTTITINNGVVSLGERAFDGCRSLASITIPDSISSIGEYLFNDCIALTSVTIGTGITIIPNGLFSGCISLTNITFNGTVTKFGDYVFYACSGLTSYIIPPSVISIGEYCFANCSGLTSITTYNTLETIGAHAFDGCDNLEKDANGIIQYAGNYAVKVYDKTLNTYTLRSGTRWIGSGLFSGCENLTAFVIPDTVIEVCDEAFKNCYNLTSITFGSALTKIGRSVFLNCQSLPNIVVPGTVKSIDDYAFAGCSGSRYLEISDGVETIGAAAFSGCISYSDVVDSSFEETYKAKVSVQGLPYVNDISYPAYASAFGLHVVCRTQKITVTNLPSSKYDINDVNVILHLDAFTAKETTVNLTVEETDLVDSELVTTTKNYSILVYYKNGSGGTTIDWDGKKWIPIEEINVTPDASKDTKVFIPASVTKIGELAFEGCKRLTAFSVSSAASASFTTSGTALVNKSKTRFICCPPTKTGTFNNVPSETKYIEDFAFSGCNKLTQVNLPSGLSYVGKCAFRDCDALATLKIGSDIYGQASVSGGTAANCYKAFPGDMTCYTTQYAPGHTYDYDDYSDGITPVTLCNSGFHACLRLCDVFNYYSGETNGGTKWHVKVYKVTLNGVLSDRMGDTKIVGDELTIGSENSSRIL